MQPEPTAYSLKSKQPKTNLHLWLFNIAADLIAVIAAYYTTYLIRFHTAWGNYLLSTIKPAFGGSYNTFPANSYPDFYIASAPRIIFIVSMILFTIYALRNLYAGRRFIIKRDEVWNILYANFITLIIFYSYFYLRRNMFHPRSFFAMLIVLNCGYTIIFRSLAERLLKIIRADGITDRCRTIVVGNSEQGEILCKYIDKTHPHGMHIDKKLIRNPHESFSTFCERIAQVGQKQKIDMIISADKDLPVVEIMQLLEVGDKLNCAIKVLSDKLDVLIIEAKMPVDMIQGVALFHFDAPTSSCLDIMKLASSFTLALFASIILLPLQLFIAFLVKTTSKGPALFVQERIGVNRIPFKMYKFRTMKDCAEEELAQIEEFNESDGGLFKIKDDPRITPIGKFLRRYSLDELPQLLNILKGEMRIVGPRPLPRRDFENYYEEWHYSRHGGMPGLTCLWQVSGRSHIDFHNMCILDVYYLRNHNWILDIKIVWRTFAVVLFAKGAY